VLEYGSLYADRYIVRDEIGRSRSARIYRVQHSQFPLELALKVVLPPRTERSEWTRRFKTEAEVSRAVPHEHLVAVREWAWDTATQTVFLAMELLVGLDLEQLLARAGPLPPQRALLLLTQAALALDAVHGHASDGQPAPIVHCDVSPRNLFWTEASGRLKLLDFGVARRLPQDAGRTTEWGTAPYLAYEQILGQAVSAQTDIWGLGLVSHFMLTGWHYFTGADPRREILAARYQAPSVRLRQSEREGLLPESYDSWFFSCVEPDPQRRFGSAGAAIQALAGCLRQADAGLESEQVRPAVQVRAEHRDAVRVVESRAGTAATVVAQPRKLERDFLPAVRSLLRVADDLVTASGHYLLHVTDNSESFELQLRCLRHYVDGYNAESERLQSERANFEDLLSEISDPRLYQAVEHVQVRVQDFESEYSAPKQAAGDDPVEQHAQRITEWREHAVALGSVVAQTRAALLELEQLIERQAAAQGRQQPETANTAASRGAELLRAYRARALSFASAIESFLCADFSAPESVHRLAWEELAPAIHGMNAAYVALESENLPLRAALLRSGERCRAPELLDALREVESYQWHDVRKELNRLLVSLLTFLYGGCRQRHLDQIAKKRDDWADLMRTLIGGSERFEVTLATDRSGA